MCSATNNEDYTDPFKISWYNGTQLLQPDGKNYLIYRKYDTMNEQIYSKLNLSSVTYYDNAVCICWTFFVAQKERSTDLLNVSLLCLYMHVTKRMASIMASFHISSCLTHFLTVLIGYLKIISKGLKSNKYLHNYKCTYIKVNEQLSYWCTDAYILEPIKCTKSTTL